jgi:TetR/AcrR family transcriptional repressor of nem operon
MPYSLTHKQETRERIVNSARRLFNRKGFTEVTIDEIMKHAGLTRGGFYRHFDTKEQRPDGPTLDLPRW